MPRPVSATTTSTFEPTDSTLTRTRPFFDVNLMAFENRFQNTCWRRSGSPMT